MTKQQETQSQVYGCDECHENCQDDGYGASDCCGAPLL